MKRVTYTQACRCTRHLAVVFLALAGAACSAASDEPAYSRPPYQSAPRPMHYESCQSDTLKMLMIGNSFAGDIVNGYLPYMLGAEGRPCKVAMVHYQSCSLEMHLDNALDNNPVYLYREVDEQGNSVDREEVTLDQALGAERWTHVSFQQASAWSGDYKSYGDNLTYLMMYVDDRVCHDTRRLFYQTWSYGPDFDNWAFDRYSRDPVSMYRAIAATSKVLMWENDFDDIVPVGTAIQNARGPVLGRDLTRDGIHLDLGIGRFVAAATWYEVLTGVDARDNTYTTDTIPLEWQQLARQAAHDAVSYPYSTH